MCGGPSCWEFAGTVLDLLAGISRTNMPWPRLTWEQCLLGMDLPAHLLGFQRTWSLLRGSVLWVLWLRRDAQVFQNATWPTPQLESSIWDAVLDLARMASDRSISLSRQQPQAGQKARLALCRCWASTATLCSHQGDSIHWNYIRPVCGVFR
ncbi:hypothetical protein Mp_4g13040 [Marchantia polymorpha subsp. ruderalis]|uniref:Reverse transcriptase zinc-binding domain-containing protein n=2 Tax=Marchantia polymorpha TaxID=3197 RepID=A0AAF6B9D4_MARPO|nr:hypothetical protein MARPO_0138s0038 [Marchantia polymorpha]BBN08618.1 hypothetical protein Mp_4g13040 [Marchantia polymorpha subsp. ruderalis]|eukprot:PTQ29603.1 hypothetical protein MARPO_0138s0038 [Marchantia polymorpha]